ncbi:hypothetical protein [Thermodesulfovibrio sp. 3462-1]|uniref:Uncharacterized protein n=1 Tax=Thermodesulfovibrio obliviosus TaxID=3118332 RepID=A0AAU8H0L1_9BACT
MKSVVKIVCLLAVLFSFTCTAFATEEQTNCNALFKEIVLMRDAMRQQIAGRTTFDLEKDKALFVDLFKLRAKEEQMAALGCFIVPAFDLDEVKKTTGLTLVIYDPSKEKGIRYSWALHYLGKGLNIRRVSNPKQADLVKKVPPTAPVCFLEGEGDLFNQTVVVRCPFVSLEKHWPITQYRITLGGKEQAPLDPFKISDEYPFLSAIFASFIFSEIKLEPEIKAWFEKEFGPKTRGFIKEVSDEK